MLSPVPAGAYQTQLSGVSCPTASDCAAVGSFNTGNGTESLVETWDGTGWSVLPSPNAGTSDNLNGVSCLSITECIAVGSSSDGQQQNTLIESWDGKSWSIVPSPNESSAAGNVLSDVSCTSQGNCVAVGYWSTPNGSSTTPLIETWNGASWSVALGVTPNVPYAQLNGVSCVNPTDCVAVGSESSSSAVLIETWDGMTWSMIGPPATGGNEAALNAVSCASVSDCVAVGYSNYSDFSNQTGSLIETWDGKSWSVAPNSDASYSHPDLEGVSCLSNADCVAVGSSANAPLIELWDGTAWSTASNPSSGDGYLAGASCPDTSGCFGVGYSYSPNSTGTSSLIETSTPIPQAITFNSSPPNPALYGGSYAVSATGGGSGNPILYSTDVTSAPGSCAINGSTVTFTGVGTCVIDANQAGNNFYQPAPTSTQSFPINKAPTTLTAPPAKVTFGLVYKSVTMTTTLTSNVTSAGISGQSLIFHIGPGQSCTATTDTQGVASCAVQYSTTQILAPTSSYTVAFSGSTDYLPSNASGTIEPIPVLP